MHITFNFTSMFTKITWNWITKLLPMKGDLFHPKVLIQPDGETGLIHFVVTFEQTVNFFKTWWTLGPIHFYSVLQGLHQSEHEQLVALGWCGWCYSWTHCSSQMVALVLQKSFDSNKILLKIWFNWNFNYLAQSVMHKNRNKTKPANRLLAFSTLSSEIRLAEWIHWGCVGMCAFITGKQRSEFWNTTA